MDFDFLKKVFRNWLKATQELFWAFIPAKTIQARPLSEDDKRLNSTLLAYISDIISKGNGKVKLLLPNRVLDCEVVGVALYYPIEQKSDDDPAYVVIAPMIKGEYYHADKFFHLTGLVSGMSLNFKKELFEAAYNWLDQYYEAQ